VGCRGEWEEVTGSGPVCSSPAQLEAQDSLVGALYRQTRAGVVRTTGCLPPCTYIRYSVLQQKHSPDSLTDGVGFSLLLAADGLEEEVEEEIYDLLSFLSESGGALGLLLGFSLFTLWDLLQPLASLLARRVCPAI